MYGYVKFGGTISIPFIYMQQSCLRSYYLVGAKSVTLAVIMLQAALVASWPRLRTSGFHYQCTGALEVSKPFVLSV